jgi:pilus assembly protein CpaE
MPDGLSSSAPLSANDVQTGHTDRPALLGFVTDAASAATLREGLAQALHSKLDIRRGNVRHAIEALRHGQTPATLVVDLSGEAEPLGALEDLSQFVEPDATVLVIGERQDMDFYRRITRGLGVREYLFKPLTVEMVARNFGPAAGGRSDNTAVLRGGRVINIVGARPGVGASTIAVNLGWYLGAMSDRRTLMLDPDLYTGTASLMLGQQPTPALRNALENPARLDELYIDRSVQSAAPRLDVLASEGAMDDTFAYADGSAGRLLDMVQRRYNFILVDMPIGNTPLLRELRERAHQTVIVLDPTLPSIRDALRLLPLTAGTRQVRTPLLVLNRARVPGGLSLAQVEEALQAPPDIVIADIGRRARDAELAGVPAVSQHGPVRDAIADIALRIGGVPMNEKRLRLWSRLAIRLGLSK